LGTALGGSVPFNQSTNKNGEKTEKVALPSREIFVLDPGYQGLSGNRLSPVAIHQER
jgi:hypothetical protein